MDIAEVYGEFHSRLSRFGPVCIAGGAVRDSLMGKQPKDWDIFILQGDSFDFDKAKVDLLPLLSDLSAIEPVVDWHRSEPFLVATVGWKGVEVQVLVNPAPTAQALIETFDWNVCLFAYSGDYVCGEQIDNIGEGKTLRLQKVTFPLSTLRRGFRFSERFKMKLERETVIDLCQRIVANAAAKNEKGPSGNEPDMPSLAANLLIGDLSPGGA